MPTSRLTGVIVAVVTPFRPDGTVDFDILTQHLHRLVEAGLHGVMVTGTAGEYANLSDQERREIARLAVKAVDRRVPVIVHTGHSNRDSMLALTRDAETAGADAVMVVPPPIVQPTQGEVEAYFREVASTVSIDVVIYNNPTRVGVRVAPETLLRLSEVSNIVAVKDSGRNLAETAEVIDRAGDSMVVLSGEGDLFLPTLTLGGAGGILTMPNIAPTAHLQMWEAFQRGDLARARHLNAGLIRLSKALSSEGKYHAAVKATMRLIGIPVGLPRLPLTDVSPDSLHRIREELELLVLRPA